MKICNTTTKIQNILRTQKSAKLSTIHTHYTYHTYHALHEQNSAFPQKYFKSNTPVTAGHAPLMPIDIIDYRPAG
jgi:hypothetical protein